MEAHDRILHKAHELFMRYGIRSVSMDEIAGHLGISKKTIYHSYTDKDALVEGVLNIEITTTQCDCKEHRANSENAVHEIFLAMDKMEELLNNFNPALLYELEKYHPNAYKKFREHHDQFLYAVMKDNLERGIAEKCYRSEINVDILAKYRLGAMFMIFNGDFFPHGKYALNTICTEITDNFLHGLVNKTGKELIEKYKSQRAKPQ